MTEFVRTHGQAPIMTLTLLRPEKANAYHAELLEALDRALTSLSALSEVQVVILRGAGRHFCAGADLALLADRTWRDAITLHSAQVFDRLARAPFVSMALLQGAAIGGGFELAMACDLRLGSPELELALPEVRHGILPAAGGMRRLGRLIGDARARSMILGGLRIRGPQALEWGLVSALHAQADLEKEAERWAQQLLEADPVALRLAKELLALSTADPTTSQLERVSQALLYELARQRQRV